MGETVRGRMMTWNIGKGWRRREKKGSKCCTDLRKEQAARKSAFYLGNEGAAIYPTRVFVHSFLKKPCALEVICRKHVPKMHPLATS